MKLAQIEQRNLKLIIADIDGTLVNENRMLTQNTKKVISRLKKHGVKFALASGRPLDEVEGLVERWECEENLFDFYIGMNGGELWDCNTKKSESFFKMDPIHLKEILELMSKFDTNPCIYYHDNLLCKKRDERVLLSIRRTKKEVFEYKDISDMYQEPNAKILFRMDSALMKEAEDYARQHSSPYWNVFRTGPFCLEFSDSRINKAYPLQIISDRYGYNFDEMVAFGDTSNDNEMIQKVGCGVCMLNGKRILNY